MRVNCLIVLLFFCGSAFAQNTYTVTEGTLQFLTPDAKLVMQKDGNYFIFEPHADIDDAVSELYPEIKPLTAVEYAQLQSQSGNIRLEDMIPYNLKKLRKYHFESKVAKEMHDLFQYNEELFVYMRTRTEEDDIETKIETRPFIVLDFGDDKRVIMDAGGWPLFVVPVKGHVRLVFGDDEMRRDFRNYKIIRRGGVRYDEPVVADYILSQCYAVDTLADRKVVMKSFARTNVLDGAYDSIVMKKFILGYRNGGIDMYNRDLTNLKLDGVRAVRGIYILQHNSVRRISFFGKNYKKEKFNPFPFGPYEPSYDGKFELTVTSKNGVFTMGVTGENEFYEFTMVNTQGIEAFFFQSDLSGTRSYLDEKTLVYFKYTDGTYGLDYISCFLKKEDLQQVYYYEEKPSQFSFSGLQKLTRVKGSHYDPSIFKVEKDGRFFYYPLQRDFRYQKLGDFNTPFTRFELPDGRKGWLGIDGVEYMDL